MRFFPLLALLAVEVLAANDDFKLVFGKIHNEGFAFVGRAEDVRNQCDRFIKQKNIRYVSQLIINDKVQNFKGFSNKACQFIFKNAVKNLGKQDSQVYVNGELQREPYTFTGPTQNIISECVSFLNANRILSARKMEILGKDYSFNYSLRGPEICGTLANKALEVKGPYVPYYFAGSIERKGLVVTGNRQLFFRRCKRLIDRLGIERTYRVTGPTVNYRSPTLLEGHRICDVMFSFAQHVPNPADRFEAIGRIHNRPFWFVGTTTTFLNGCASWAADRQNRIRAVYYLDINGIRLKPDKILYGGGICGLVFKHARRLSKTPVVRLIAGRVSNQGFTFVGAKERFNTVCMDFLERKKIKFVNSVYNRYRGKLVKVDFIDALRGSALCGRLAQIAEPINSPFDQWKWSISARLNGRHPVQFVGTAEIYMNQCIDYFKKNNRGTITTLVVDNVSHKIDPGAKNSEICLPSITYAKTEKFTSFTFVGGRIGNEGFSFAHATGIVQLICKQHLERRGVQVARSFVAFDRAITPPTPIVGADKICDALITQGVRYQKEPKAVDVKAEVNGVKLEFKDTLSKVNFQCINKIEAKGVKSAKEVKVKGKVYQAPNQRWEDHEICSVVIRRTLGTQ